MEETVEFMLSLSGEERALVGHYAGFDLPDEPDAMDRVISTFSQEHGITPSGLLATTAAQASFGGDDGLALKLGEAALKLAGPDEELQLAHVSLAQIHYHNRRDPQELESFENHCLEAIGLGHAGTFCYERLAALYEYRREPDKAIKICQKAIEVLEDAGDTRSVQKFQKRLERISRKGS